jgi:hypothetical protein
MKGSRRRDPVALVVRHQRARAILAGEATMEKPVIDEARNGLRQAVGSLYQTFRRYPLNHNMRACPCCADHLAKRHLFRTGLQGDSHNLARYESQALYTWSHS